MKIAFVHMYAGINDRGSETFLHEVAQRLSENHEVISYQAGKAKGWEKYYIVQIDPHTNWNKKDTTITFVRMFFLDYWSRRVAVFSFRVSKSLFNERPDIIIPVNGGWQPLIIRITSWIIGAKVVISGQSGGYDDFFNLYTFPNAFAALSTKAQTWARKVNPFIRVEKIPNGVNIKRFTEKGEKLTVNLKKPVVVAVGALNTFKRMNLVIDAVTKLQKVSLLIVGDGALRDKLKKKGQDQLANRFFLTKVPFSEMQKVYRLADVFTLPSHPMHSFEIVLVEAMATNIPVVANNDPIRKEIVGDAGILVDPRDTDAYAKAIQEALSKNWGDKPRKQAEKFSWDKIALKYEELFVSILKK